MIWRTQWHYVIQVMLQVESSHSITTQDEPASCAVISKLPLECSSDSRTAMQLIVVDIVVQAVDCNANLQGSGVLISDFLVEDMTLDRACALTPPGSTSLLELVWNRGLRSVNSPLWSVARLAHTEPHYCRWVFTRALMQAVERGESRLLQWLLDRFPTYAVSHGVLCDIVCCHRQSWFSLVRDDRIHAVKRWEAPTMNTAANSGQWEIVHELHDQQVLSGKALETSSRLVSYAFEQNNMKELY